MTIWQELAAPFTDAELEWKPQTIGRDNNKRPYAVIVPYVQARAIMDRLDRVVGPNNWSTDLRPVVIHGEEGFICTLTIVNEGPVSREDVAPASDIEPMKGAASGALKRVAVQFGIGRYLYALPTYRVFSGDIQDGYPPRDVHDAVILKSEKHEILGWCHAPSLNGNKPTGATPEDVPPPTERPVDDDGVPFGEDKVKSKSSTDPLPVGRIARRMKSKIASSVCAFCGHKHIEEGMEIVGVEGIRDKPMWGYGECYEMWCKERGHDGTAY